LVVRQQPPLGSQSGKPPTTKTQKRTANLLYRARPECIPQSVKRID
jgi:hypothetical protein